MAGQTLIQPPFVSVTIEITRDADWHDSMPVLRNPDGSIISLVGAALQLYVRPALDHSALIAQLAIGAGINVIDTSQCQWEVFVPRESVIANLPVGSFQQFAVLTKDGYRREMWRGPFIVHPARI